jgi:outer membrane protein
MNKLIKVTHLFLIGLLMLLSSCASFPGGDDNIIGGSLSPIKTNQSSDANDIKPQEAPNPNLASLDKINNLAEKLSLSLRDSIQIALTYNRQLAMSHQEKTKSKGRLTEAQSVRYPHLNLSSSYTRVNEAAQAELGGQTIEFGKLNNYKAELGLITPLYAGGRDTTGIKLARLGIKYSEEDFRSTKELITFLVSKAYYDVLLAQDMAETTRKSLELIKAHLDEVTKIYKQGLTADYDLLRAQVQVTNINTGYLQSVNQLQLARTSFINILGLPLENGEQELKLTDKLIYESTGQLSEDKVQLVAFQNRADLTQARLRVSMQRKNIDLVKGEALPTFFLFSNVGRANPPQNIMGGSGWDSYWNIGAMFAMPVFEGGRIKGKITQERAALQQVQLMQKDIEEKIRLDVKQALLNLKNMEELVNSQKENVKQAEEGLRLARLGYEQGIRTQLEVLDTQMALDSARKNMSEALYAHMMARLMLDKAMGILGQK